MGQDGAHNNNAPAPFLTKTYEMVDDPVSDDIVSWSSSNDSFVVWNPVDFARELLPQYFKHNNFSSFVRQLNTYGFRKIDPERWEFATESFSKGNKDSLKNIHRRKPQSHHSHRYQGQQQENQCQVGCNDPRHSELEEEIKELKKEKGTLLMELLKLKELQHGTELELQNLADRLQALEGRQQQMVTFLARAMQSPSSFSQFIQQNESNPLLLFNKKRRLTGQDAAPEPVEAAQIDSPKAISRLEPPEGIFKQLTISCASLSGGSSSMSYNSGGTPCEINTFAGHPETPSTDVSGHSAMDVTASGDDPARQGFGDSIDVTVPEKGVIRVDVESLNVSVLGHGDRGHGTESDLLGNEKETEAVPAMPSAVDVRNAPVLQASQTPGYSTKKPSRKMNRTSGSNDMFWENFLTESPRTTDSEAEDDADDQEDETSPRERQFL